MENLITRREAMARVSALLGGMAFVGGNNLLAAVEGTRPGAGAPIGAFSVQDIAFLDEISETILPATKTPGAKAAKTGAFMALMVTDCYSPVQQKVFLEGMRKLDDACKNSTGVAFMAATPEQRLAVLTVLDQEQKHVMDSREAAEHKRRRVARVLAKVIAVDPAKDQITDQPPHYFRMMKELTLLGYFTSEIGCKQALRYVEAPGRFDPCIPYKAGDPAWAQHA
jgi:Gluconate 2-dehydrogenase subunit 3